MTGSEDDVVREQDRQYNLLIDTAIEKGNWPVAEQWLYEYGKFLSYPIVRRIVGD